MALSHVVVGEKITANLFNDVIDSINSNSGNTPITVVTPTIRQTNDSFVTLPDTPDWVNNYTEDEIHSWRPKNIWVKQGPLEILEPYVNVYNSIKVCELDPACNESEHDITGQWYCGVRKDELGEHLNDKIIAAYPKRFIYTNNTESYSGEIRISQAYSFQAVFSIFQNDTKTDPSIYTYQNLIPVFNDSTPGGSGGYGYGYKSLFDYVESGESETYLDESGSEHERFVKSHYVVRNIFYYNDQEESLPDYKVLDKDSTVYLHVQYPLDQATQSKPDKSHKPTFVINENGATTGDYAYRLWELDNWDVKCDCRTSLVPLYNPWDESESEPGGGGGGVVQYIARGPFEPVYSGSVGTSITGLRNCIFQWERRFLDMGQQTLSLPSSTCWILLEITHPTAPNPGADVWPVNYRIRIETGDPFGNQNGLLLNTNDTITLIPLYKVTSSGIIEEDYRATPLTPVYR